MSGANPPLTNRGVTMTKEYLTALIDWCQITVKDVTPVTIAEEILRIPYQLMNNDLRGGMKGYKALMCFDDIRIFEPSGENEDNGYQILMTGQGCRNFEIFLNQSGETWFDFFERVLEYNVNFPRVDLAIDDRKTYFNILKLKMLAKKGLAVSKLRIGTGQDSFLLKNGDRKGDTINFGSRSSELFLTFYEKNYEQAEKLGLEEHEIEEKWNRYELKFRQKRAVNLVHELVKRREVFTIAMEVLNENIRFVKKPAGSTDKRKSRYPVWEPWAWFMQDVSKLNLCMKPQKKDYYDRLEWLRISCSPTLRVFYELDKIMETTVVWDLIRNAKLTDKHLQMIEDFKNQLNVGKILDERRLKHVN